MNEWKKFWLYSALFSFVIWGLFTAIALYREQDPAAFLILGAFFVLGKLIIAFFTLPLMYRKK